MVASLGEPEEVTEATVKGQEQAKSGGYSGRGTNASGLKRYNLVLPEDLFKEVQELADAKHTSVVEIIRQFIKLGLIAAKLEDEPDSALIIREGGKEREILIL